MPEAVRKGRATPGRVGAGRLGLLGSASLPASALLPHESDEAPRVAVAHGSRDIDEYCLLAVMRVGVRGLPTAAAAGAAAAVGAAVGCGGVCGAVGDEDVGRGMLWNRSFRSLNAVLDMG